jgi:serine/threonine protein kinase
MGGVTSGESPSRGSVLGHRYRLMRRLGTGGMAAVWLAQDERLGREVAVKILSDALAGDRAYRPRFEREARVAARFAHSGLVGIHDYGTEAGRPYLVMELVRGDTLADRVAAGEADKLDHAGLARELLGALAYMHAAGVVHRDLKPGNILLAEDGRAQLTDFGIAQPEDATALTETGKVVGTLSYLAPEVRRGGRATPRSDLYALGVVLRESGAERDPALAGPIDRLTAEDPSSRPASAAVAQAILDGTPPTIPAARTEPTESLPRTTATAVLHRHRGALIGLAVLIAAALAIALASSGGDAPGPVSTTTPLAQDTGRDSARGGTQPEQPTPAPAQEPTVTPQPSCAGIEERKKVIEERQKAQEEAAGSDKGQKEAIKVQFEEEKKALEEEAKACKED